MISVGQRPLKPSSTLEARLSHLLGELCVEWGFCIPPADAERIARSKHLTTDQFAVEVLVAEGMHPEYEKQWRKKMRDRFVAVFGHEVRADA